MILREVAASVAEACGSAVAGVAHVGGGDINEAREVRLEDGRRLFLKFHPGGDPAMFPAEARGLEWLAEAGPPLAALRGAMRPLPPPPSLPRLSARHLAAAARSAPARPVRAIGSSGRIM